MRHAATSPQQADLFSYVAPTAPARGAEATRVPLPLVTTLLARAKALNRLTPVAPEVARNDGVVPLTADDAVAWCRAYGLEWPGEAGVEFKLGVEDAPGRLAAVCIGARPVEPAAPRTVELAVISPRADGAHRAYQIALDRGAKAALAMGYTQLFYYRPEDPGHPVDLFAPLAPRPYRLAEGGSLSWQHDGFVETVPWLRALGEKSRRLRAAYLMQRHIEAVFEWEDAKEARELEKGDLLEEEDEAALAQEFGFDYYDGWRPHDMTARDMEDWLLEHETNDYERFVLRAPPSTKALYVEKITKHEANAVLPLWHSHLPEEVKGHLFSLGVYGRAVPGRYPEHLRAVAVASMPIAQAFTGVTESGAPRRVVEVVRVAVNKDAPLLAGVGLRPDGRPHASGEASFVLRHIEEACLALGFDRIISSTLLGEAGAGYRAAGWRPVAVTRPEEWSRKGRERRPSTAYGWKIRWETGPGAATPVRDPNAGTVDALVKDGVALFKAGRIPLGGVTRHKPNHRPLRPTRWDPVR